MKNKIFLIASFTFLICISSFAQTANVTEGCAPLEVFFTAPAGTTRWFWDFKDGVTSDFQNPSNVFNRPGTYLVTFHETTGGPSTGTIEIIVYPAPVPKFSFTTGCAPFEVSFTNLSEINPAINVTGYVWLFGDQQKQEGPKDVKHLYNSPGKYDITLNIQTTLPSCEVNKLFVDTLELLTPPAASFTTTPANTTSCENNLEIAFTNTSNTSRPLSYSWDMGNGTTSTEQNPPSQKYTAGQYTVTLKVAPTDLPACSSTTSKTVNVGGPQPTILKDDTVCVGVQTLLETPETAGSYTWTFGPNATRTIARRDTVFVTFNSPGYHKFTLRVTSPDNRCASTITDSIYADQVTASIESEPSFSCSAPVNINYKGVSNQSDVSYFWRLHGESAEGETVSFRYNIKRDSLYGNHVENVVSSLQVISNKTGCGAFVETSDIVRLPNARFMPDIASGCMPLTVTFSDSSQSIDPIVSWKWLFGDGSERSKTILDTAKHTFTKDGIYMVKLAVTTRSGCIDTSYAVKIEVGKNLTSEIDFTADKNEVCPGEPVVFTAETNSTLIDGFHFETEDNKSFHCFNNSSTSWSYNEKTGFQDVALVVDYNGCLSRKEKPSFINVKGAIAKIDFNVDCNKPLNYNFVDKSQNATSLTWDFGDGATGTTTEISHTYALSKNYNVVLTASNGDGCTPTTDHVLVKARNVQSRISIDTVLCINTLYSFSANSSIDVFADCYTGYTWQFPTMDKRPHTSQTPVANFGFTQSGVHFVRLITTDENGCKDTASTRFKVHDMDLKVTVDDSLICTPGIVNFTNLSTSDTTQVNWLWNFGDDSDTVANNPSHTYLTPPLNGNEYSPYLVVLDQLGCSDTLKFKIKYYKPTSNIAANDLTLCLGDSVRFTATDYLLGGHNLSYNWDFGNGETGNLQSKQILYTQAKDYNVNLVYKENVTNCTGTTSVIVKVQDFPKAVFTTNVDSQNVLCAPQNVFFQDASISDFMPLTYRWNFGDGKTSTIRNPNYTYSKGEFTATQTVSTSHGCSTSTTKNFKVYRPEGDFTMSRNVICKGEEITFTLINPVDVAAYTWAFGDGTTITKNISETDPVSHTYNFHPPSGKTLARLVVTGEGGICPLPMEKEVNIHRVIADFDRGINGDTTICFNDGDYPFVNKSIAHDSHSWDFDDGSTSEEINPIKKYAVPGVYNVRLTVANNQIGCKDTIIKPAIIYANPIVLATGDTVCKDQPLTLAVSNPNTNSSYLWTPSTGLSNATTPSVVANLSSTVNYTVVETDTNQCTGSIVVPAIVIEDLAVTNWDTTIVIGDTVNIPVSGPDVYIFKWSPADGLSCTDCNRPSVRPLDDIQYNLNVTDLLGCFEKDLVFNISVKKETFVKMPTAFTPADDDNDQSANNKITVQGWGIKELLEFNVFNRWGQLLYSSNDLKEGWDGKFKGVVQNNDVYVYKVKVLTWKNEVLKEEGYFNLIH